MRRFAFMFLIGLLFSASSLTIQAQDAIDPSILQLADDAPFRLAYRVDVYLKSAVKPLPSGMGI